jgi:hypothetical protein
MRVAITIIVIIGVLASVGFGAFWVYDYNSSKDEITADANALGIDVTSELNSYQQRSNSGIALIVGGIISLIAVIMIKKLQKISAIIFLLSAIVPAVLAPLSLVVSFLLIIGGILAFFYKPKAQTPPPAAAV